MPDGPLAGKVAIVTGASSGIGEAIAGALASEGASVVLAARRAERLEATARAIEEAGGTARALTTDVTSQEEVAALARTTLDEFGRIDVLVNNAGVMPAAPMVDNRLDDWKWTVDVNLMGALHAISAVLPTMIEQDGGHVVNIGSVAGRRPTPGATVYAATKFAMRALSWGMHLELGSKHGIKVTDIQPGFTSTEILDHVPDEAIREAWQTGFADRRPLRPEDVAQAVLFAVTAPDHVAVSEVLVRSVDQAT